MTKSIEILITKYFLDTLSAAEAKELITWLEKDNNQAIFNEYVEIHYTLEKHKNKQIDHSKLWESIQPNNTPVKKLWFAKYAIAASLAIIATLSFFYTTGYFKTTPTHPILDTIHVGTDKATLTLEDGSLIDLEKTKTYVSTNAKSNGENITYQPSTSSKKEIVYNYLTIPRGGQYKVHLSDGTKVWLNSGSKLKYPVQFIQGETRQVELVYGEAYFEVSPREENYGDLFSVVSKGQEIEVLGTKFNINTYAKGTIASTLLEGEIILKAYTTSRKLEPGQQALVHIENQEASITFLEHPEDEIEWIRGVFNFKEKDLNQIMEQLSRWYNIDANYINEDLKHIKFTAKLSKNQDLENILDIITKSTNITYEIENKKIILK